MNKFIFIIFFSTFVIFQPISPEARAQKQKLIILNWASYLDPVVEELFEEQFNVEIHQVYYESDEDRDDIMLQTQAEGFDVILASGIVLNQYAKRGWLLQLDRSQVPNLKYIMPRWESAFEGTRKYGVPYFWGTLGIVYRSDRVEQPLTSWQQLFMPADELKGKIIMMNDSRDLVGMGLKALGYSANSEDAAAYQQVQELLLKQKKYVAGYSYVSTEAGSPLLTGEIIAAMAYSGDALMAAELNDKIRYVLPEEGGNIWVDFFTIAAKAKSPDLAYAFLNFINQPEHAARQAQYVYYASPNEAAQKLLPQEFLEDETIYPPPERLEKSEFYQQLSPEAYRLRSRLVCPIID
jgi:spermidine/putrescine transport system substrate-binding protein